MRVNRAVVVFAAGAMLAGAVGAQSANLLTNPSFENGLTGWTVTSSTASSVPYGGTDVPSGPFSTAIGGLNFLLRDIGGNAQVEQTVNLPVGQGANLMASGFFGGDNQDEARLALEFLDAAGGLLALRHLDYVTEANRLGTTILMARESIFAIPAGSASVRVRVEFRNLGSSVRGGAADALFVGTTHQSVIPPALPLATNLIVNGDFESGWSLSSPLTPATAEGWQGISGSVWVAQYGTASAPSAQVSCVIGGGDSGTSCLPGGAGNVLRDANNGVLRQRIDVRGNAFANFGTQLHVSAYLGALSADGDDARIDVRFLDAAQTVITPLPSVGPVTPAERNWEDVLMKREQFYFIPAATAYIEVDIAMTDCCASTAYALVDNVRATLETPVPPAPHPYRSELVVNGNFESSSLPGSPLTLNSPQGWTGSGFQSSFVEMYGAPRADIPAPPAAALGIYVLEDAGPGNSNLRQTIDLSGNARAIATGNIWFHAEAWLGGYLSENDTAELNIQFMDSFGFITGGAAGVHNLGPVTAAMRGFATTLIPVSTDAAIPVGTTRVQLEIRFVDVASSIPYALADGISFEIYDILNGGPNPDFPGSADDFEMYTGVNGMPTSGPGHYVKNAVGNDILIVRLASDGGAFDFAPVAVCYNVFATGGPLPMPPAGYPAGFSLDPFTSFFVAENGFGCSQFGCPIVLPGGTTFQYLIPAGVTGTSIVLQSYATPPAGGPVPNNGFFAASNGHEIQL